MDTTKWRSTGLAPLTHLVPRVSLDLWELEFCVVRVHFSDLLFGGCAQHLDDLHQLVHPTVPGEDGLTQQQLRKHTPSTPDVCREGGSTFNHTHHIISHT